MGELLLDEIGNKYNMLTILSKELVINKLGKYETKYLCQCDCGNKVLARLWYIKKGTTKSCGCYKKNSRKDWVNDLSKERIGLKIGKWTIIQSINTIRKNGTTLIKYLCKCECGIEKIFSFDKLNNNKNYCGCCKKRPPPKYTPPKKVDRRCVAVTKIFASIKKGALNRELSFLLTKDEVAALIFSPCHYCGNPHSNGCTMKDKNDGVYKYNGIDRVDSSRGYSIDNVVPCCKWCNYSKMSRSVDDFLSHIYDIYIKSIKGNEDRIINI
jgi:hypothetical protein